MVKGFGRFLRRNTIALLALFLALGGTTYAASSALIGKNTVASPQVVNGSLQTKDLSKKARKALKGNRGPRGSAGAQGAKGATGLKGATGAQGVQGNPGATTVAVREFDVSVPATSVAPGTAVCHAGERATGGGALLSSVFDTGTGANSGLIVRSYPSTGTELAANDGQTPTSWTVRMYNPTASAKSMQVYAICASP